MESCCLRNRDPNLSEFASFAIHSHLVTEVPVFQGALDSTYCRLDALGSPNGTTAPQQFETAYIRASGECLDHRIRCTPQGIIQIYELDDCQGEILVSRQLFTQKQFFTTTFTGIVDARWITVDQAPFTIRWTTEFPLFIRLGQFDTIGILVCLFYSFTTLGILASFLFFGLKAYQSYSSHYQWILVSIMGLFVSIVLDIAFHYTAIPLVGVFGTALLNLTTLVSILTTLRFLDVYYPIVTEFRILRIRVGDLLVITLHLILAGPKYCSSLTNNEFVRLWILYVSPFWTLAGFLIGLGTYIAILCTLYRSIVGASPRDRFITLWETYSWSPIILVAQTTLGITYVILHVAAFYCATFQSDTIVRQVQGPILHCALLILILIHFMFGYLEKQELYSTKALNNPKFKNSILF
jgi:hypothetical protein